jgi:hypothetical protein
MRPPPRWTPEQLEEARQASIRLFREARVREPLAAYLRAFDENRRVVGDLLAATGDLLRLDESFLEVVTDVRFQQALRYLPGPPISTDDLKTLSDAVLAPGRLRNDPAMAGRILEILRAGLDRRRFPWVGKRRSPSEGERHAAIVATCALMATSQVGTGRRSQGKAEQEALVAKTLSEAGLAEVPRRSIQTLHEAPPPLSYCRESLVGTRKADFVVSLRDRRVMPIECKVSNSAVNSVKRLNNDAAAKAEAWTRDFGGRQVVPAAVLSGVYKLPNLLDAQARGLTLFWAHDLAALVDWIVGEAG